MSTMTPPESAESAEDNPTQDAAEGTSPPRRRRGLLPLLVAVVLVGIALFAASQFIGVLYGLVFPAKAPVPSNVTELEYSSEAYGVDQWLYSTSEDACVLVRFFENNGGVCNVSPDICSGGFIGSGPFSPSTNVAQCTGDVTFSIFAMRWRSNIATGYSDGDPTRFQLGREVYWTGILPSMELEEAPLVEP